MKPINIFGLQVERKTEILALVAFLLSLSSIVSQVTNWFKGPEIIVKPPLTVTIHEKKYMNEKKFLSVTSDRNYINIGSLGYHDILLSESLKIMIKNRDAIKLSGLFLVTLDRDENLNILTRVSWP